MCAAEYRNSCDQASGSLGKGGLAGAWWCELLSLCEVVKDGPLRHSSLRQDPSKDGRQLEKCQKQGWWLQGTCASRGLRLCAVGTAWCTTGSVASDGVTTLGD